MTDIVVVTNTEVITTGGQNTVVVDDNTVRVEVIERVEAPVVVTTSGAQGPAGPTGPQGPAAEAFVKEASGDVSALRALVVDENNLASYADNTDPSHAFIVRGVSTNAVNDGDDVTIQTIGELSDNSWSWTPGLPIFVSTAGALTQTPPATGFLKQIAEAMTATSIYVALMPTILR